MANQACYSSIHPGQGHEARFLKKPGAFLRNDSEREKGEEYSTSCFSSDFVSAFNMQGTRITAFSLQLASWVASCSIDSSSLFVLCPFNFVRYLFSYNTPLFERENCRPPPHNNDDKA